MDIVSTLKQVALSLFVRRKKWIALTVAGALVLFLPVEDLISNPYGHDYQVDIQNWFRRLRGEAPVVDSPEVRALEELRGARVAFFPQGASGIVQIRAEASNPRVAL